MNRQKVKFHEKLRLLIQAMAFVFHNGYLRGWMQGKIYTGTNKYFCAPGMNCYSCPGATASCPIGSLQAVLDSGHYKMSLYVFGFIAAIGLFSGRLVCGWICPFGLIQDLLYKIPFPGKRKNLPGHKYLRFVRFGILAIFVIILPIVVVNKAGAGQPWFCEWICPSGTLLGGYPLAAFNANLRSAIGFRFIWKSLIVVAVLIGSAFAARPFCKYVCPLGALYGLCNPISAYRLKVDKDKCVGCKACQKACYADIPVWEKPNSVDCIRCGKCMASCPKGCITSTFGDAVKAFTRKDSNTQGGKASMQSSGKVQNQNTCPDAPANKKAAPLKSILALTGAMVSVMFGYVAISSMCSYIFEDYAILNIADTLRLASSCICFAGIAALVAMMVFKLCRNIGGAVEEGEMHQFAGITLIGLPLLGVILNMGMTLLGLILDPVNTYDNVLTTALANSLISQPMIIGMLSAGLIISAIITIITKSKGEKNK